MEKELSVAKKFNKAAMVIIIVMLILMSLMAVNMRHLAERYTRLELKYEELYEERTENDKEF